MTTKSALRYSLLQLLRILYTESKLEVIKCLRLPAFSSSILSFPLIVYIVCGVLIDIDVQEIRAAHYWLVAASSIGMIGTSLFGFGVYIAIERGQGWLLLKQVSPLPIYIHFLAKAFMAMVFCALITSLLVAIAFIFGSEDLGVHQILALIVTQMFCSLPFCMLGLVMGCAVSANSAHAIVNLIYLPMLFLSGIIVPYTFFPAWLQSVAHYLPSFHSVQLALSAIGAANNVNVFLHLLVLSVYTVVLLVIGMMVYKKMEDV